MAKALVDFREIEDGERFELFVRELLIALGVPNPVWMGRGADSGRDLYFTETCQGVISRYERKWLVQCKHLARSVSPSDLGHSVVDRCVQHSANGYLLVCSLGPSSSLRSMLDDIASNTKLEIQVWDGATIERLLIEERNKSVLMRFFPMSFARLQGEEPLTSLARRLQSKGFSPEQVRRILELHAEGSEGRIEAAELLTKAKATSQEQKAVRDLLVDFVLLGRECYGSIGARLEKLPYEESLDFLHKAMDLNESDTEELVVHLFNLTHDAGRQVNYLQFLIDEFRYKLHEVFPLLKRLELEDLELILEQFDFSSKLEVTVERYVTTENPAVVYNHFPNATIEEVHIQHLHIFFTYNEEDLKVEGQADVSLSLEGMSSSVFAAFTATIAPDLTVRLTLGRMRTGWDDPLVEEEPDLVDDEEDGT